MAGANETTKGGGWKTGRVLLPGGVVISAGTSAPTSGTTGTAAGKSGPGSFYFNATTGLLYINVNTKASPTWQLFHPSGSQYVIAALAANGAIAPHTPANYMITKAGVLAATLAAPTSTVDDGVEIMINSSTGNAHTVTATGLLQTGSAAVNVATFNPNSGAGLALMAYQAKWYVTFANGVSFS